MMEERRSPPQGTLQRFVETCMNCDLREELRKRVTYTVLGILVTVNLAVVGLMYTDNSKHADRLYKDMKGIALNIAINQTKVAMLEANYANLRLQIKETNDVMVEHIRNVVRFNVYGNRRNPAKGNVPQEENGR